MTGIVIAVGPPLLVGPLYLQWVCQRLERARRRARLVRRLVAEDELRRTPGDYR